MCVSVDVCPDGKKALALYKYKAIGQDHDPPYRIIVSR